MYRALLLLALCFVTGDGYWVPFPSAHAQSRAALSAETLNQELGSRIERVPEFLFIREQAEKLGVKVYLFGGTAAAYGHYVKEDLLREAGDTRFPAFRFDYDYTNIFRSTQDLDVVIDGSAEQAAALEAALKERFPHFMGEKAQWEIRPLRVPRENKEAILNNPDFANQHTDSHSTGLVEITRPEQKGLSVRDVRDWENQKKPQFLQDVLDSKLHYYFSPNHALTNRAQKGLNPPILSAIRYLTKAFQYGLEIGGEDRARIKKIIHEIKPDDLKNDYVRGWIEKNGKKLIQHSLDIERAWNELEDLGLRQKLIALQNNPSTQGSLAWWLSKEPLRSAPLGSGKGKTAAEIAKERGEKSLIVSHETNSFLAWESISRDRGGALNALISRTNAVGETAAHGEGFYTRIGKSGARGTGFTIRMELDPKAREGTDFIRAGDFIILRNKEAARVIPEQIKMSLSAYLQQLAEGKEFSKDDRALLEKMKRSVSIQALDEEEVEKSLAVLRRNFASANPSITLIDEWFSLPISNRYPELAEGLIKNGTEDVLIALKVLSRPHMKDHPHLVEALINKGTVNQQIAQFVLSQAHWKDHPHLVEALIKKGKVDIYISDHVLSQPHWKDHPHLVEALINKGTVGRSIARFTLSGSHWGDHHYLLEDWIKKGGEDKNIATYVLPWPHWKNHPHLVEALIKKGTVDREIARYVLTEPHWGEHPHLLEALIKKGTADKEIDFYVLTQQSWRDHPQLRALVGGAEPTLQNLREAFLLGKTLTPPALSPRGKACPALFGGM